MAPNPSRDAMSSSSVNAILARNRDVVTPSPAIAELTADVVSPVRGVRPPTKSCGHTRHSRTIIRFLGLPGGREREVCRHTRSQSAPFGARPGGGEGEPTLLTDYGEPRAVITSIKATRLARRSVFQTHRNSNNAYWPFRLPLSSTSSWLGYNRRGSQS